LRSDGSLFIWGLGANGVTNLPAGITNITAIAAGEDFSMVMVQSGISSVNPLPATVTANVGAQTTFTANPQAGSPITYQWTYDGALLQGATNRTLILASATLSAAGSYGLILSNSFGLVTNPIFTLNISPNLYSQSAIGAWGDDLDQQCEVPPGILNPTMIAAGRFHNLVLQGNGTVVAWGQNWFGQTNVPALTTNVIAVAAGGNHSLALENNGSVVAWGYNGYGQTSVPPSATNIVAIAAGWAHSVALSSNGTVIVWGDNDFGQTNTPPWLTNVIAVAAGYYHTLALLANHSVFAWGSQSLVPAAATNVMAIAAGSEHNLALRADGSVIAWGDNSYGQCSVPASVTNAIAIAAGYGASLAMLADGTIAAWGQNNFVVTNVPLGLNNLAGIACGENHAIALISVGVPLTFTNPPALAANVGGGVWLGGDLAGSYPLTYQWCQNGQPLAGATNRWLSLIGLALTNAGSYTVVSSNLAGTAVSAAINLSVSNVPCFAPALPVQQNALVGAPLTLSVSPAGAPPMAFQAQLNGNNLTDGPGISGTASPFISFNPATYADDGILNLVVTNEAGSFTGLVANLVVTPVVAWGNNLSGQLEVSSKATNVVALATGGDHSVALRADGSLAAWGDNTYGQNQVPASASNVVAVAEGETDSLAIRSDGTIVAWGDNTYGQTNVPTSANGAVQVAAGSTLSEALLPNGTVIAWESGLKINPTTATNVVSLSARGGNYLGLCANGSVIGWGSTTPPALTNALAIAAGASHGLALLADTSVAAWGSDDFGQVDVPPSVTNIVAIAAGDYDSIALRADGALFVWGLTNYNQTALPPLPGSIAMLADGGFHHLAVLGEPLATTVAAGSAIILTSGNLGTGLGTFQWLYNGTAIAGATHSFLTLSNLQVATSGRYQVVVSNPLQVVTGPVINVVVPPFQFDPASLAYQPATGSVQMRLTGASGTHIVVIYASTNLSNWRPVYTNAPTVNPISFTDAPPTNIPARFYRAAELP